MVRYRTAGDLKATFRAVSKVATKKEKENILKDNSLNEPKPAWLRLPDLHASFSEGGAQEDRKEIRASVRDSKSGIISPQLLPIEKFGFHSVFTSEHMHNWAQGRQADALKQTTPYFTWLGGEALSNRLTAAVS